MTVGGFAEIEAKLQVASHASLQAKLKTLGAEYLTDQEQEDIYYDDTQANLLQADKALRLRIQKTEQGQQFFITFKGPKQTDDLKKRQEIEFTVEDAQAAQQFLMALGYHAKLTVEKQRQVWRYRGCLVGLDHLAELGFFVEIEGPDSQRIRQVQRDLELTERKHIQESYACLIQGRAMEDQHVSDS
jgi:adenylate cyclase, class 2